MSLYYSVQVGGCYLYTCDGAYARSLAGTFRHKFSTYDSAKRVAKSYLDAHPSHPFAEIRRFVDGQKVDSTKIPNPKFQPKQPETKPQITFGIRPLGHPHVYVYHDDNRTVVYSTGLPKGGRYSEFQEAWLRANQYTVKHQIAVEVVELDGDKVVSIRWRSHPHCRPAPEETLSPHLQVKEGDTLVEVYRKFGEQLALAHIDPTMILGDPRRFKFEQHTTKTRFAIYRKDTGQYFVSGQFSSHINHVRWENNLEKARLYSDEFTAVEAAQYFPEETEIIPIRYEQIERREITNAPTA